MLGIGHVGALSVSTTHFKQHVYIIKLASLGFAHFRRMWYLILSNCRLRIMVAQDQQSFKYVYIPADL